MTPRLLSKRIAQGVSLIDVLADHTTQGAFGYRFGGCRPRPNALFPAQPDRTPGKRNDLTSCYWAALRLCSGLWMIRDRGAIMQHA